MRFVFDDTSSDYDILLQKANTSTLEFQRKHQLTTEVFKTLHDLNPPYMKDIFKLKVTPYILIGYFILHMVCIPCNTLQLLSGITFLITLK